MTGPIASRRSRPTPGTSAPHPRSLTARSSRTADGTTDFSVLQNEIVMVAVDLLYLNGYDLRKLPLIERKTLLKKLVNKTHIQFSESFEVDGPEMFKHACKTGLEGVVSKVRDSNYPLGRSNNWVKVTCAQRETLPIAGFGQPV
jgi:bifunctional non-homologous end joining protein LigD